MHEAQTRETNRHDWQTLHTGTREAAARGLRQDLVRAGVPEGDLARRVTEAWAGSVVRAPGSVREFRVVRVEVGSTVGPAAGSGSAVGADFASGSGAVGSVAAAGAGSARS
jgi:hypothetical protein